MLISELNPTAEILGVLRPGERVFVLSCGGCAEVCRAGGEEALAELRTMLATAGHPVMEGVALVGLRLARWAQDLDQADALLVVSCGVGVVGLPVPGLEHGLVRGVPGSVAVQGEM